MDQTECQQKLLVACQCDDVNMVRFAISLGADPEEGYVHQASSAFSTANRLFETAYVLRRSVQSMSFEVIKFLSETYEYKIAHPSSYVIGAALEIVTPQILEYLILQHHLTASSVLNAKSINSTSAVHNTKVAALTAGVSGTSNGDWAEERANLINILAKSSLSTQERFQLQPAFSDKTIINLAKESLISTADDLQEALLKVQTIDQRCQKRARF